MHCATYKHHQDHLLLPGPNHNSVWAFSPASPAAPCSTPSAGVPPCSLFFPDDSPAASCAGSCSAGGGGGGAHLPSAVSRTSPCVQSHANEPGVFRHFSVPSCAHVWEPRAHSSASAECVRACVFFFFGGGVRCVSLPRPQTKGDTQAS